ncbi:uncharacterized protein MEPE_00070 [Melanopsichium pennsylvanicum]|uniref:Uncharacterized protein n=1 Tax=Melanopsichium pennsylvanicum TaxID=63383 RepID=A0AAJ4XF85_9BASI|nr:uncharacterized protein MEPE_00070 [Melanopsichium pennsylvanicum]
MACWASLGYQNTMFAKLSDTLSVHLPPESRAVLPDYTLSAELEHLSPAKLEKTIERLTPMPLAFIAKANVGKRRFSTVVAAGFPLTLALALDQYFALPTSS